VGPARQTVGATHVTEDREFTDFVTVDAHGRRSVIHTTVNHSFWNASTRSWTAAGQLQHDDGLSSIGSRDVRVVVAAHAWQKRHGRLPAGSRLLL
jgi:hypothetical protein